MARPIDEIQKSVKNLAVWYLKQNRLGEVLLEALAAVVRKGEEVWDEYKRQIYRLTADLPWLEARGDEIDVPPYPWETADGYRERLFRHFYRSTPDGVREAIEFVLNRLGHDGWRVKYTEPHTNGTGSGFFTDTVHGTTPADGEVRYLGVVEIPMVERERYGSCGSFTGVDFFTGSDESSSHTKADTRDPARMPFARAERIVEDARPAGTETVIKIKDRPSYAHSVLFDTPGTAVM